MRIFVNSFPLLCKVVASFFQISLASTSNLTPSIVFSIVVLDKEPIFPEEMSIVSLKF